MIKDNNVPMESLDFIAVYTYGSDQNREWGASQLHIHSVRPKRGFLFAVYLLQ